MSFIFPLMFLIFFTETLMIFFKTKFEKTLPLTFFISAIMLYLSQFIFHTFKVGYILNILFCLIFPIYVIKNKKKIKEYITPGLIGFISLYIIIFILDFNRFFTRWDELSHWGKMVKEMYKLDSFYSISTSNLLVHKDYPPIMSLLELFFCFLSGKYKEVYLIRCMHLFEGTLILSCINFKEKNNKSIILKTIIISGFIYLVTFLFDSAIVINSIYTDYVLALLTAYILYNEFTLKKLDLFNILNILFSLIFILLLKQVSIAFYLMIIFFFIINFCFKRNNLSLKKKILITLIIIIIPILFLLIWNNYVNALNIKGQFNVSDIKINSFKEIINSDNYQKQTIVNYVDAIFNKSILNSNINLSYFQLGIILLFILIFIYKIIKDKVDSKKYILYVITLIIGYFGYALLMLLLYVYSFGEIEGPMLASYDRYMSSYILICIYSIIFIYLHYKDIELKNNYRLISLIFLIALMIKPISYLKLRPDLIILNNHHYDAYRNAVEVIDKNAKDMDKVYIIDQIEKDGAMYYINYFSNKISTNVIMYEFVTNIDSSYDFFYDNYYDYMKDFNYLYTYSIDETFIEKYSFLTNGKIKEKTLYKIENKKGKIELIKIDEE